LITLPRTQTHQRKGRADEPPPSFSAKIAQQGSLIRTRVPSPLLKMMGARDGDELEFKLDETTEQWLISVKHRRASRTGGQKK